MNLNLLETIAGQLVALAAGLGALGWLIRKGWSMFRKLDRIADALDWIQAEMKPNGGTSLRDAIDRVDSKVEAHLAEHAKAPVTVNVGTPGRVG